MITPLDQLELNKDLLPSRLVVRVSESFLAGRHSKAAFTVVRSIKVLRRLSNGHDILSEDVSMTGADAVEKKIVNFRDVAPGLYTLITINARRDFETGIIDDYGYKLVPYEIPRK